MKAEILKKSILQLAVEGKLVPQIESEEPASVLLEKIREEKEQLIKDKKIKRDKNESVIYRKNGHFYEKVGKKEPVCIDDEIPFDIPDSWEWARIASIGVLQRGKGIKKSEVIEEGFSCIRYGELYSTYDDFVYCTKSYIGKKLFDDSFKVANDEVLMTLTGENKIDIGRAIANKTGHLVAFGGDMIALKKHNMDGSYLVYAINSPCLNYQRTMMATGSIIIHLSLSKIGSMLIPIPPFEEQHRIVKRIEEILPHIEEYNLAEQELTKLNQEFPEKMKKSILQYAVEGKLVPQLESEEPASVLLEKIREEKEQLIKDKKIKRDRNESVIYRENGHFYEKVGKKEPVCIDDETPFDIPDSWEWCRLGSVSKLITKGTTPKGGKDCFKSEGIGFLRGENVAGLDCLSTDNIKFIEKSVHEGFLKRSILMENDILITIAGTLGRTGLIRKKDLPLNINQAISFIRLIDPNEFNLMYLVIALNAPMIQKYLIKQKKITAIPNLTLQIIRECLIPIPPLSEQHRIVKRIEEILPLIENL